MRQSEHTRRRNIKVDNSHIDQEAIRQRCPDVRTFHHYYQTEGEVANNQLLKGVSYVETQDILRETAQGTSIDENYHHQTKSTIPVDNRMKAGMNKGVMNHKIEAEISHRSVSTA